MKKANNSTQKLKIEKLEILVLTPEQMSKVEAGDESLLTPKPVSFDCIPPFNKPPFFDTKTP